MLLARSCCCSGPVPPAPQAQSVSGPLHLLPLPGVLCAHIFPWSAPSPPSGLKRPLFRETPLTTALSGLACPGQVNPASCQPVTGCETVLSFGYGPLSPPRGPGTLPASPWWLWCESVRGWGVGRMGFAALHCLGLTEKVTLAWKSRMTSERGLSVLGVQSPGGDPAESGAAGGLPRVTCLLAFFLAQPPWPRLLGPLNEGKNASSGPFRCECVFQVL